MATNYDKGAAFEREVSKDMEGHGYKALRSAGSHKPADVVALRVGETIAIQCKCDGTLRPDEWNKFWCWCQVAGAKPVLASRRKEGRKYVIIYQELLGRKDGRGRQPLAPWVPQTEGSANEVS